MAKKSAKGRDEMMLATIRINAGLWQDFQEFSRQAGTNASALVVGFIERCLAGNHTDGVDTDAPPSTVPLDTDVIDKDTDVQMNDGSNRITAGVLALTGAPSVELVVGMVDSAVEARLGDRIRQLEAALAEYDTKLEKACNDATSTAAAFIDSQIEKAIAPLKGKAIFVDNGEIYQPEVAVGEFVFEPELKLPSTEKALHGHSEKMAAITQAIKLDGVAHGTYPKIALPPAPRTNQAEEEVTPPSISIMAENELVAPKIKEAASDTVENSTLPGAIYSATEVGAALGLSASKIGKAADEELARWGWRRVYVKGQSPRYRRFDNPDSAWMAKAVAVVEDFNNL